MITQQDLAAVVALQVRISDRHLHPDMVARAKRLDALDAELAAATETLQASPAYRRFETVRDSVSGVKANLPALPVEEEISALDAELGKLRERLKKAYRADPRVQLGFLCLEVESTLAVAWQDFWKRVRAIPAVALVLGKSSEALALETQAANKDPLASFVTARITRFEVVSG